MTQEALKLAFEKVTGIPDAWTNPALMQARNGFIQGWEAKEALAQTQEPDDIASILACRDMLDAQSVPEADRVIWPERTEQNFCPRCGKRTADLTTIHTCTPPQD